LKDLNADWRHIVVESKESGKGMGDTLGPLMQIGMMSEMGKQGGNSSNAMGAMMGMMFMGSLFGGGGLGGDSAAVYYTKGQTLTLAGNSFIVAYRAKKNQANFLTLIAEAEKTPGKEPDFAKLMGGKLTPESPLSLCLLNMKTVAGISDIRPFD